MQLQSKGQRWDVGLLGSTWCQRTRLPSPLPISGWTLSPEESTEPSSWSFLPWFAVSCLSHPVTYLIPQFESAVRFLRSCRQQMSCQQYFAVHTTPGMPVSRAMGSRLGPSSDTDLAFGWNLSPVCRPNRGVSQLRLHQFEMDFMGLHLLLNPQLFHTMKLNVQEMLTDLSCILSVAMKN